MQTVTDPFVCTVGAPTDVPSAALTADAGASAQLKDLVVVAATVVAVVPLLAAVVVVELDELEQAARATGRPRARAATTNGRVTTGLRIGQR